MEQRKTILRDSMETASFLKISIRQLQKLKKEGKISFFQNAPKGRLLFTEEDIEAYINQFKHKAKFEI
jgi:hypothetical protein